MEETKSSVARPLPISWKQKAGIVLASLAFAAVLLGMIGSVFREPMFVKPAKSKIDQVHTLSELGPIQGQITREGTLQDRYFIFGVLIALALPITALILLKRATPFPRIIVVMAVSGLFWGVSLGGIYGAMHRTILPGGFQDPRYRFVLQTFLLVFSLLDCLLISGIVHRISAKKARKT